MRLVNSIFQVFIGSSTVTATANENSTGDFARKYSWPMNNTSTLIRQFSRALITTSGTSDSAVQVTERIS